MKRLAPVFAALGLTASCVVMTPVTPPPQLEPLDAGGPPAPEQSMVAPDAPPEVVLTRGGTARLVRPLVNGVDVGWFVLDTGVAGMLISSGAADQAGLSPVGATRLPDGGVTTVYLGETFQLGPLTVVGTRYAAADFPRSHVTFGETVVGFCTYDVLAQTVFELELERDRLTIHDPSTYGLPEGTWQPLVLDHGLPHAWCRFADGHDGLFLLDAGYPGAVQLFQHVVEQHQLLEARRTRLRTIPTLGAQSLVRQGELAWFEIGPQRLESVEAQFAEGPSPQYPGSARTSGIVGADLLRGFRIVLDYSRQRLALIPVTMDPQE